MNRPLMLLCDLILAAVLASACGSSDEERVKSTPIGEVARTPTPAGAANEPPRIDEIQLQPVRPLPGGVVTAHVQTSDPEGDAVRLSFEWRVDGERAGSDSPSLQLAGVSKGASIEVTAVPHDAHSQGASRSAGARVGNLPPVMLGVVIEPLGEVHAGQDVSASPRANDSDGDELEFRYAWRVNGEDAGVDGPVLPATRFKRGDEIELTVVASDGQDSSAPLVSQPVPVVNASPTITSAPGSIGDDGTFRYAVRVEDPDKDRSFRYRLLESPEGMKIDVVTGELTWAPSEDQAGSHPVVIEVGDRNGGTGTQAFEVTVAFEQNAAPAAPAP